MFLLLRYFNYLFIFADLEERNRNLKVQNCALEKQLEKRIEEAQRLKSNKHDGDKLSEVKALQETIRV